MAQNTEVQGASSEIKQPTAAEMLVWFEQNKQRLQNYAEANDAIKQLQDITKSSKQRTISAITKENLRNYLQNPTSNEVNIRALSRYLYYRSQVYYRIVKYFANMFDLNARSVIPPYSLTEPADKETVLQSYNETLQYLHVANLQYEFLKIYTQCWRDDLFCGVAYWDETGFFVLPLDLAYCKVEGVYPQDGSFAFAFDMTFFNKYPELLEYWGEPFQSMYNSYLSENIKWQTVPGEYAVCLKARAEDWETNIPPLVGIFESLLNLIELEDVQAIANEQQIYKLLIATLPTISNTNSPDDWAVNPKVAIEYFNKMADSLPDYVGAAISPIPITPIEFTRDATDDVSSVQKATETVLNTSGGAQVLNGATISGTTAWTGAIRSDSEFAISMLLPQTQAVVNRLLASKISTPSKVKFFETTVYLKHELRESLMQSGQYGLPTKLALNSLNGFSELETMALNFLEEDCLGISEKFVPLQSSHTQSGNSEGGAPKKDDGDLTDDGEASRDKSDKAKG